MRALALVCLLCSIAGADAVVVVGRVGDGAWTDAPTAARVDQRAELAVVMITRRGVLGPAAVTKLRLRGATVKPKPFERVRVQWSTVEPHGFRERPATNGATSDFYSNVSTERATFGTWLGYDHIDYFERVVRPWSDALVIAADVTSGEPGAQQVAGLGTVRYKVELELADGTKLASPGAEAVDTYGVLPAVHRVTVRSADDFMGQLSGYLLVPEVFGSAGGGRDHQTERYTGADCADVLVGAARRAGYRFAYTNVAGLPGYTTRVAGSVDLDDHGVPARPISGVRRGDLIRIDYGGALRGHTPRDWDHVAALWEDRSDPAGPFQGGPDGKLDGYDLVIHMGHPRLVIEPLARQAPATVDVLRWKTR